MKAGGRGQGMTARALAVTLVGALTVGATAALVVAPGADGRARSPVGPTISGSSLASEKSTVSVDGSRPPTSPGGMSVVPVALHPSTSLHPSSGAGTGYVADPTTEAEVAVDLVYAIDSQSDGRDRIAVTADNVSLLETWMDNEGGLWADNPLNTSLDTTRYPHQITTSGLDTRIPIFPDIQVGIAATATTLLTGHAYTGILEVLSTGTASCPTFARAVMASPWAASHYGGDPAHFCGTAGDPGPTAAVAPACLRLRGRPRTRASVSSRMPGTCGRSGASGGRRPAAGLRPALTHGARDQKRPGGESASRRSAPLSPGASRRSPRRHAGPVRSR